MVRDTAYFIAAIRQLSNTETDPIVSDTEVRDRASEGLSALYDMLVGAYEHYAVKLTDPFTLAGGVNGCTYPLPSDFYKDVSLTLNPSSTPVSVHRMSSWVDRNNLARRGYILMGSNLTVRPAALAQGTYQLAYTPLIETFQAPTTATASYPSTPITRTPGSDAVDASLSLANWFFLGASFGGGDVGKMLGIAGASNPGNNGMHLVQAVDDSTDIRTSKIGITSENFPPGMTAGLYVGPFDSIEPGGGGSTLTFREATFTGLEVGAPITVAGSLASDGTYTLTAIIDAHTVQVAEVAPDVENFLPGVTVSYQEPGTVNVLPQIFVPWYEFIQVHGAIAVKDKIEQDTSDLVMRLGRLTARIQALAANRMEEGGQIALPNEGGGFWDEPGTPWG